MPSIFINVVANHILASDRKANVHRADGNRLVGFVVAPTIGVSLTDQIDGLDEIQRRAKAWSIVEWLRAEEGASITIVCDNPGFNEQPNSKIICRASWTDWDEQEFFGDTILDALKAAEAAAKRGKNP